MENIIEKRNNYRRYEDRRIAMLLSLYEIYFQSANRKGIIKEILNAIRENFQVEKVDYIKIYKRKSVIFGIVEESNRNSTRNRNIKKLYGKGFERLIELHEQVDGALSLESVRKSEAFEDDIWRNLWEQGTGENSKAVLSVKIGKKNQLLWLKNTISTREWSSRDRQLIEEVAELLKIMIKKSK